MSKRSDALMLMEEIKEICEPRGFEVSVRAIAMQAMIFQKINPELWEIATADARVGLSKALPETEN